MRIGATNNQQTQRQKRLAIIFGIIGVAVVGLSTWQHFTFHDVKAVVVGSTVMLSSRADGRIERVFVTENDTFKAGTPLVQLANPSLRAEMEAVEHEVAEMRRSLALERSGLGLERRVYELETSFAEAKSKLAAAQIGLSGIEQMLDGRHIAAEAARERAARAELLVAEGAMTPAEFGKRRQDALDAQREYTEALGRKSMYESEVATYTELLALHDRRLEHIDDDRGRLVNDIEVALAEKDRALARLQTLWRELTVVAASDGIVTALHAREGEYKASGQPIVTVMTSRDIWVEAYLPPEDKRSILPGDLVFIDDPASSGRIAGKVRSVLPVLRPFPTGTGALGSGGGNFAVLHVTFEDNADARSRLSPAQEVNARIRRRWMPVASAKQDTPRTEVGSSLGDGTAADTGN